MASSNSSTCGCTYGDRGPVLTTRAMPDFGQFVDNLVVGREDVVSELDLDYRPEAIEAHAEGLSLIHI